MTMITFNNDEQRDNFRKNMALIALKTEATSRIGLRMYRGSIINVLKKWFPDLPRTKKSAYKYLIKKGYYDRPNEQPNS